jgi:hypothetical protein
LLDSGDDDAADAALRGADRIEAEGNHLAQAIAAAEAKLSDWPTAEVDAALDFYSDLRDAISDRVKAAKGFDDLHAALRSILAQVDLKVDPDGVAVGMFELVGEDVEAGKVPMFVHIEDDRWVGDIFGGPEFPPPLLEVQRAAAAHAVATGAPLRAEQDASPSSEVRVGRAVEIPPLAILLNDENPAPTGPTSELPATPGQEGARG